ncbi:MAG: hypothetical protein M3010_04915, partial [Candidatus Dormibacteraeota bacterium]|nr:hypothetical protein [Candidatus Dormibacteraeota bacterium]
MAWVVGPLAQDVRWSGNLEYYRGTFWFDSFGPGRMFGWISHGELLDAGRAPILTILALLGLLACLARWRRAPQGRALVGILCVSLLLFSGRSVVGPVVNLLPGGQDLPLHRYVSGIQLASLGLVGVAVRELVSGAAAVARSLAGPDRHRVASVAAAVVGLGCFGASLPAYAQISAYDASGAEMIQAQQAADATTGVDLDALAREARAQGDGRVYAGTKGNWGRDFKVGQVPVYSELENLDVDALGMWLNTESISSDVETRFNDQSPAHFALFNVGYEILPLGQASSVPARLLRSAGGYSLWKVPTPGYISIVDTGGVPVAADRQDIGASANPFLQALRSGRAVYPVVAFAGLPPLTTSLARGQPPPATDPGEVVSQHADLMRGRYEAQVVADRPATIVLHSTFDPRWRVFVDGVGLSTGMVAPSLVGRTIPAGNHRVEFRYEPIDTYPLFWLLGLIALVALANSQRILLVTRGLIPGRRSSAGGDVGLRVNRRSLPWPRWRLPWPRLGLAVSAGGVALALYLLSAPGHLQTVDIRSEFAVAQSIVGRGDFTVNPNLPYVTVPSETGSDGRPYSHHGLGQSLLLTPAAVVGRLAGCPPDPGLCPADAQRTAEAAASLVDPICAALTVLLFVCLSRELGFGAKTSLLAAAALGLGT